MFDFEKLEVYKLAKEQNSRIIELFKDLKHKDKYIENQFRRASVSIVINIAEGSGKFSKKDKANFYTISRGSVYECVSLLGIMRDNIQIDEREYQVLYEYYEVISRMLYKLAESQRK